MVPKLVFIPTIGRTQSQHTWESFPADLREVTTLVCPASEVEEHLSRGRNAIACPATGIAATRQWICENSESRTLIMCDDDHKWFVRAKPDAYNLRPCTLSEVGVLFSDMRSLLVEYPLVGVSRRQHNNAHFPAKIKTVTRQCNIHGVDVRAMENIGCRWDDLPLMEDFHITLSFLERGHANAMIVDRAWDQHASNAAGGCSTYRNNDLQEFSAKRLQEMHPRFVDLVTKESKTGWENMKVRTDVRVAWKKAFNSGRH